MGFDRSKNTSIAKKLNAIAEDGTFFEDFLVFAVCQLEEKKSSGLPDPGRPALARRGSAPG